MTKPPSTLCLKMAEIIDARKRKLTDYLGDAAEFNEKGETAKALDVMTLANRDYPGNPECMAELALLLAEFELYDEAVAIYGELLLSGQMPDEQCALEAFGIVMPEKDEREAFYKLVSAIFPSIDADYFLHPETDNDPEGEDYRGEGLIDEMQRALSKGDYAAVKRYYRSVGRDSSIAPRALGIRMKASYLEGNSDEAFAAAVRLYSEFYYSEAADIILRVLSDLGNEMLFNLYLYQFKERAKAEAAPGYFPDRLSRALERCLYSLGRYRDGVALFKELFKAGVRYELSFLAYSFSAAFVAEDDEIVDVIYSFVKRTVPHCTFFGYLKSVFDEFKLHRESVTRDKYLALRLVADNALFKFTRFPGYIAQKPSYSKEELSDTDPALRLVQRIKDPYLYEYSPRIFAEVIKTLSGHVS